LLHGFGFGHVTTSTIFSFFGLLSSSLHLVSLASSFRTLSAVLFFFVFVLSPSFSSSESVCVCVCVCVFFFGSFFSSRPSYYASDSLRS
jgi:hypothetical protein